MAAHRKMRGFFLCQYVMYQKIRQYLNTADFLYFCYIEMLFLVFEKML